MPLILKKSSATNNISINITTQQEKQKKYVRVQVRKSFLLNLKSGSMWQRLIAPFSLLHFDLMLMLEDIVLMQPRETIKFNFMYISEPTQYTIENIKRMFEQLYFSNDSTNGNYDLAETRLFARSRRSRYQREALQNKYSRAQQKVLQTRLQSSRQLQRLIPMQMPREESFKYLSFNIPFYKYPIVDIITIIIPLQLISALTLFTFGQSFSLNDRIANIATLMIVYVGLIPMIRDSLPGVTGITFIDIVVYIQILINLLCLVTSFIRRDYKYAQFQTYVVTEDPFFLVSLVMTLIGTTITISLIIYYCCIFKTAYNYDQAYDFNKCFDPLTYDSPLIQKFYQEIQWQKLSA